MSGNKKLLLVLISVVILGASATVSLSLHNNEGTYSELKNLREQFMRFFDLVRAKESDMPHGELLAELLSKETYPPFVKLSEDETKMWLEIAINNLEDLLSRADEIPTYLNLIKENAFTDVQAYKLDKKVFLAVVFEENEHDEMIIYFIIDSESKSLLDWCVSRHFHISPEVITLEAKPKKGTTITTVNGATIYSIELPRGYNNIVNGKIKREEVKLLIPEGTAIHIIELPPEEYNDIIEEIEDIFEEYNMKER